MANNLWLLGLLLCAGACEFPRIAPGRSLDFDAMTDGPFVGEPPRLISPVAGASTGRQQGETDAARTIRFTWAAVQNANRYEIEISENRDFSFVAYAFSETVNYRDVTLSVKSTVPVGTRYYWRVRVCFSDRLCSAFSTQRIVNAGRAPRDLNGDGYSDVVISAPFNASASRADVFFGGGSGLSLNPAGTLLRSSSDVFGASVSVAGDVNDDGYCDIVAGATLAGGNGGAAMIYYGSAGSSFDTTEDWVVTGTTGAGMGGAVAPAGDVNGDGISDIIIGASGAGGTTGAAYLYLGGRDGIDLVADATLLGTFSGERFGIAVSSAGDVNGDGLDDVIIGTSSNNPIGAAILYYGDGVGGLRRALGLRGNAHFGDTVSAAGDVNGDGFSDFLIGAHQAQRAYLYHGGGNYNPVELQGTQQSQRFGISLSAAGDLDRDGRGDFFVGALNGVYWYSRDYVSPLWLPSAAGEDFGNSVSAAGDVNGDGSPDWIVGAAAANQRAGRAYVFHSNGGSFNNIPALTLNGSVSGEEFGYSVGR